MSIRRTLSPAVVRVAILLYVLAFLALFIVTGLAFGQDLTTATSATRTVSVASVPPGATAFTLTIEATDGDAPGEGQLFVGAWGMSLFGTPQGSTANNGKAAVYQYRVPMPPTNPWVAGANTVRLQRGSGDGFVVTNMGVAFEAPAPSATPPFTADPALYAGLVRSLEGTPFEVPDYWLAAVARGTWGFRVMTYRDPDWWFGYLCNPERTSECWAAGGRSTRAMASLASGVVDPATLTGAAALTECERTFTYSRDEVEIIKACAYTYTPSTTATTVPVYAATDGRVQVGRVAKGRSCSTYTYAGPAASANQYWFGLTAPDTKAAGFVRCVNRGR